MGSVLSRNYDYLKDADINTIFRRGVMTANWMGWRKAHPWMYLCENLEKGSTGGRGWNLPEKQITLSHRLRDPKENRRKGSAESLHWPL